MGLPWGAANPAVCLTWIRAARRLLPGLHGRIQRRDADAAAGSGQESKHRFLFGGVLEQKPPGCCLQADGTGCSGSRGKKTAGWSVPFCSRTFPGIFKIRRMEKLTRRRSEWLRQRQHGGSLGSRSSPQQRDAAPLLPSREDAGILNRRSISAAC